jgi:hypothetical protein
MYSGMTAAAFRAALARLGLSHSQAAVLLEQDIRLIRDWASGAKLIPQSITYSLILHFLWKSPLKIVIPVGAGMFFSRTKFNHWCTEAIWLPHNAKDVPTLLPEIVPADLLEPVARPRSR